MIVYVIAEGRVREHIFDNAEEVHICTDNGNGLQITQADPKEYGFGWEVREVAKEDTK